MWSKILGWSGTVLITWLAVSHASIAGGPPDDAPAPLISELGPSIDAATLGVTAPTPDVQAIETLIEDAMEDGAISGDERQLILAQARRRLGPAEFAGIETRLTGQPASPARLGTIELGADDAKPSAPGLDESSACCDEHVCGSLCENMYFFGRVEGWQGTVDDDSNPNNFGGRVGVNMGWPLKEAAGIGAQFGVSYGFYNFHGRGASNGANGGTENSSIEDHLMLTFGLFHRADLCEPCPDRWSWGVAYDRLLADNIGEEADEIALGQWRIQVGYALSASDEVGFWTTLGDEEDELKSLGSDVHPLHQCSIFWHHKWCEGADTRAWFGVAEDPGSFVFGADAEYPLNDCVALTARAQYILPSSRGGESGGIASGFEQEFWNIAVGLAYYPGGTSKSDTVAGRRWMPYFDVADNGSFALETLGD